MSIAEQIATTSWHRSRQALHLLPQLPPASVRVTPSMTLEVTIENANLLQLAEALFLNAEKVQPNWDSVGLVKSS